MDLKPPANLDVTHISQNWRIFKINFEIYSVAKELHLKSEEVQVATLLNILGEDAVKLVLTLISDKSDLESTEAIISILDEYVTSKENVARRRYLFNTRAQQQNETFEEFFDAIKELAEGCEFEQLKESLIRDKIIAGIQNEDLKERLLAQDYFLPEVVKICVSCERKNLKAKRKNVEVNEIPVENVEFKRRKESHEGKQGNGSGAKVNLSKFKTGAIVENEAAEEIVCGDNVAIKITSENFRREFFGENHKDKQNFCETEVNKINFLSTSVEKAEVISILESQMDYNPLTFWKNLPTLTVKKAKPAEVLKMTQELFKSLLIGGQPPAESINLAYHVASQLRSPEDSNKLMIDSEGIETNTKMNCDVLGFVSEATMNRFIRNPRSLKKYGKYFTITTEKHAHIWGPFFAFYFLRHALGYKVYLGELREHLFEAFGGTNYQINCCPNFDQNFLSRLNFLPWHEAETGSAQYNTLMYGLISAQSKEDATPKLLGLLGLLCIRSQNYKGMSLFILIDELTKYFKCCPKELAAEYCYPECKTSWEQFFVFKEKCLNLLSEDKFWCYARIFKEKAFFKLSYVNNYFLCNLLALHLDFVYKVGREPFYWHSVPFPFKVLVPTSKNAINNTISAHDELKKQFNSKMGSQEAEQRLMEAAELVEIVESQKNDFYLFLNGNHELPTLSSTDYNYILLTHVTLQEKLFSQSLIPLARELIPKERPIHDQLTIEEALNSVKDFMYEIKIKL